MSTVIEEKIAETPTFFNTPQFPYSANIVYDIPIKDIYADEDWNCRGFIDPISVYDLAKDIKAQGLIQPITVMPYDLKPGKRFKIVAGYRRYKATMVNIHGIKDYPPYIRATIRTGLSDLQASVLNLSENLKRRDLNKLQEALAIKKFYSAGWNDAQIAREISLPYNWVRTRVMILELPDYLQKEVAAGLVNDSQIKALYLLGDDPDKQLTYYKEIKDAKITGKSPPKPEKAFKIDQTKIRSHSDILYLQDIFIEKFGLAQAEFTIAIKVLGWTIGLISDIDLQNYMVERAKVHGIFYVPEQVLTKDKAESLKVD